MIKIEFFGISGSGKTYLKNLLKKKNQFFDYEEIIMKFLPDEEKNIFKKTLIKNYLFYKIMKKKRKEGILNKQNFTPKKIYKETINLKKKIISLYFETLEKTYKKFKKENKIFASYTEQLIRKSNFNNRSKKIFFNWFKKEAVAHYLINKNKKKVELIIDSEGLLQRLFIYSYKKKNKSDIIKKYLNICKLPNHVLVTLDKCYLKKKHTNTEFNLNVSEQRKIYDQTLKYFKKFKINFKIVDKFKIKKLVF